jgi:hypothetical protein
MRASYVLALAAFGLLVIVPAVSATPSVGGVCLLQDEGSSGSLPLLPVQLRVTGSDVGVVVFVPGLNGGTWYYTGLC